MRNAEWVVIVDSVCKYFGDIRALDGLTLRVKHGEIYGLIGPNGAGKTTLIKILVGLLKPDHGSAKIYGYDVISDRVRALNLVGYVPENPVVFQNLTVEEFIRFLAALRNIDQREVSDMLDYYLDVFNLRDKRYSLMSELSRGMVQKVLVIAAFVVKPKVLIMDEPMAGMDPESQHVFKEEVKKLVSRGATVLISSHLLDIVERFCTRVGIIYKGKLLIEGEIEYIKKIAAETPEGSLEEAFLKIIGSEK